MLHRDEWLGLARKLDWEFTYVREEEVFPEVMSGKPWLDHHAWKDWEEPFRTSYTEYVKTQNEKDASVYSVRDAVGRLKDFQKLEAPWLNGLKLHAATLPLAEFAAVIGNLRGARFGRDSAWRTMSTFGAMDEFRHTQIPLMLMHPLVKWNPQFDWTHKFYHSKNWVSIAARHLFDELLLGSNAIEFAVATNFVLETGFTNLQFIGLASIADQVGDRLFEKMVTSIQTDEARHAQIGEPVLRKVIEQDREYAQYLLDKWFWRSWLVFAVVTGFSMDYLTPIENRDRSFKDFMEEWVIQQYLGRIEALGMKKPWYWDEFVDSLDRYHHMVYASAYTYRSSVWFDMIVPGPREREWLKRKYPKYWKSFASIWEQISERWAHTDRGNDFGVHGTAIPAFCNLCQLVLCNGSPDRNSATVMERDGQKYIFCSAPCRWIFESEPERYATHKDLVKRVLAGEAPANLIAMLRQYFGLKYEDWGKDAFQGDYPWIKKTGPEEMK